MSEKLMTLHPAGKQGVHIDKAKYTIVREAILAVLADNGMTPFTDLSNLVAARLPDFDGSYGWYTTTVKLDLEARGEIERVPGKGPQRLRLSRV